MAGTRSARMMLLELGDVLVMAQEEVLHEGTVEIAKRVIWHVIKEIDRLTIAAAETEGHQIVSNGPGDDLGHLSSTRLPGHRRDPSIWYPGLGCVAPEDIFADGGEE